MVMVSCKRGWCAYISHWALPMSVERNSVFHSSYRFVYFSGIISLMPPTSAAGATDVSRTKLLAWAIRWALAIWVLIKITAASSSDVKRARVDLIGMSPVWVDN